MPHTFGFDSVGGGSGSSGITDLNGLTVATQSFAVGTAGVDFGVVSVSPTHTFNLPDASAVSRGALTSADWSTFNGKLSTAILSINGMTGTAQTINSGSTGTDLNIASVGNVTTINIPDASTTARGLVTTGMQTFGGAKTFTQNSNNAVLMNGTWTQSATGQRHVEINPNITLTNVNQATGTALYVNPTMIATANQQTFNSVVIGGTYTGFGTGNNVSRLVPLNVDGMSIAGGRTSTILIGSAGAGVIPSTFGSVHIGYNVGGGNSILIGYQAGLNGGSGSSILIGGRAGFQAGNSLIGIGGDVAFNVSTPTNSVIIGATACQLNSSGANATFFTNGVMIGTSARSFANTDNNAIVIGASAIGQGTNSVVIGDNNITRTFLKGDTAIGYSPTTATITPSARLDVLGSSSVSGNALVVKNSTPTELFKIENTGNVLINPTGLPVNMKVSGDTIADLLVTVGSVDAVCVGTNTPIAGFTTALGLWSGGADSYLTTTSGDYGVGVFDADETVIIGGSSYSNLNAFEVYKNTFFYGRVSFADGVNIELGTSVGTQLASANNQLLGLWGATPIAQPTTAISSATYVSNVGTGINTNDTFDGYTLAQVVKALRDFGILA